MSDLHIMRIKGSGFLNLKTVDLKLDQGVVRIAGKNRQGKTNLLRLIKLMGGKREMPELAKMEGQKKGKATITLGDAEGNARYLVKWSATEKNTYLTVEDCEGEKVGLEILKDILSPVIDPWTFYQDATAQGAGATARKNKAIELLKELMEVTYDPAGLLDELGCADNTHVKSLISQHRGDTLGLLKALEEMMMDNRKAWKQKLADLEGSIATLKKEIPPEDRDAEEVDIQELFAKQKNLQSIEEAHNRYEMEFGSLEEDVKAKRAALEQAEAKLEAKRAEAETLPSADPAALEALEKEIESITERNERARKAKDLREKEGKADTYAESVEARTEAIERIREARTEAMETAAMPVEGLSIEGGNILKNGIPLGQDSHEEGLTDALLIGLAKFEKMHPDAEKLKTLLLPDASLLDSDAMSRVIALAEEHGVQLVLELVMDQRQNGVIFVEDGEASNVE